MTKKELNGYIILMKADKTLLATKKIRIYQREKLVDRFRFLIPYTYEDWNGSTDNRPDLSAFIVVLQYIGQDGTIHAEQLQRMTNGQDYEDYEDLDGNATHMIYELPINTKLTQQSGDITLKLNLQYTDYEALEESGDDDTEAPEPVPIQYVLQTDDIVISVLPVADYYSIVPDESLSIINNKIEELNEKIAEFNTTAEIYDASKADDIELDDENGELYLTSKGKMVGTPISLDTLGDELADHDEEGLIKVII